MPSRCLVTCRRQRPAALHRGSGRSLLAQVWECCTRPARSRARQLGPLLPRAAEGQPLTGAQVPWGMSARRRLSIMPRSIFYIWPARSRHALADFSRGTAHRHVATSCGTRSRGMRAVRSCVRPVVSAAARSTLRARTCSPVRHARISAAYASVVGLSVVSSNAPISAPGTCRPRICSRRGEPDTIGRRRVAA